MFNHGPTGLWPRQVSLADITRYTLVVSPRHDDLVITARAPYNVTCWLVGRDKLPQIGLPGCEWRAPTATVGACVICPPAPR
ncbi:hypothetical protein AB0A77_37005 [Streptomyces varsoviensis]|uniref:hypothetical protein n=1 Tax=Streptomyces varsoviensis TaxID=67373 RepID=UPI0033E777EA